MWDIAYRNITRQKTRTILTTLGIVIGIATIIALGSISEGIQSMIEGSLELLAGKIIVSESGASFMTGFSESKLTDDDLQDINSISGVKEVVPIQHFVKMPEDLGGGFGPVWVLIGVEPEKLDYVLGENVGMDEGRTLEDDTEESLIIGPDFSEKYNLDVGDMFTIEGTDLEIVGIYEKTSDSDLDGGLITPLETLKTITERDYYQMAYVIVEDLKDTEIVAERIQDQNEDLSALTSVDIARQAGEIVSQIRIFTLGIGAISAFVGGLGIMNTMIMAVMERRREIGVMKAIGATKRKVILQFLQESIVLSLIGGLIGIGLGTLATLGISSLMGGGPFSAGRVTPELAGGALLFAIALGFLGGLYPSWKAANLDPVEALRYE